MNRSWIAVILTLLAPTAPTASWAAYSLFDPVPRDRMRPLSTDRPDKTESPYTVDAGHFQIEADLLIQERDESREGESTELTRSTSLMVSNLKAGLTESVDLQVIVAPYEIAREAKGFGDTVVRLKVNLLGNDAGPVALGLMPFAKLPTATRGLGNGRFEGGILFPVALALPGGGDLGLMTQLNRSRNTANEGFHTDLISTVVVGYPIVAGLSGYLELFSLAGDEPGSSLDATLDAGLTYLMTADLQLDAGVNVGLTPAADDLNPFLGFSLRI